MAAWGAAMSATAISATSILTGVGVSMMLGGVVQMLTPQPSFGAGKSSSTDNTPNYAFGARSIRSLWGILSPAYGLIEAGGAIVSAGMYSSDQQ
jgi:predicted phage tail protein